MTVKLDLIAQRDALVSGFDNEFYGLLELSHKKLTQNIENGKKLNLSLVIDKSGSMYGLPIREAKKAAVMMVEKMRPTDQVSIIAYDDYTDLVVPSVSCYDKRNIINSINNISTGGFTNLHGGWLMGAEQVALKKNNKSINRVLLLSDGGANVGLCDLYQIKNQCSRLAETDITTSTYGLGDSFNEQLMVDMASAGLGHSYYGQTSEDLMDPFNEEFETLIKNVASQIKVIAENPLIVHNELMNNYNIIERSTNRMTFNLPDLAENGTAWSLFKLNINQENIGNEEIEVLRCNISFIDNDGNTKNKGPVKIVLKPVNQNAFSAISEDEKVRLRITEINVARFQELAREAARIGDWAMTDFYINEAKKEAKDHEWLNSVLDSLENYAKAKKSEQFSKEAIYSSEKINKRLVSNDELNMNYNYAVETEKEAYLRRKMERGKRF